MIIYLKLYAKTNIYGNIIDKCSIFYILHNMICTAKHVVATIV